MEISPGSVSDDTSGQDDMLETEKTSMTADEWFAETESEPRRNRNLSATRCVAGFHKEQ